MTNLDSSPETPESNRPEVGRDPVRTSAPDGSVLNGSGLPERGEASNQAHPELVAHGLILEDGVIDQGAPDEAYKLVVCLRDGKNVVLSVGRLFHVTSHAEEQLGIAEGDLQWVDGAAKITFGTADRPEEVVVSLKPETERIQPGVTRQVVDILERCYPNRTIRTKRLHDTTDKDDVA